MTHYGNQFIEVSEISRLGIKVGDECKVGNVGSGSSFHCEPAKVVRIQKDQFGGHRICVQGQKSKYKVYCTEGGWVSTKRFGNNIFVMWSKMTDSDIMSELFDFNKLG